MPTKQTIQGVATLMRWWNGPPVLIIVPCPPEPAIRIRDETGACTLQSCVPSGPVVARPLTKTEKRFLLRKGMDGQLINSGRVFAVSDELKHRFDTEKKALFDIAQRCGLSKDDMSRILEAKRKVSEFRPTSYLERKAARVLRGLLGCEPGKKARGRPGRVTAEDHIQMHADADQLRREGKTTNEIVRALAQRYDLRYSYTRRILEDANHAGQSPTA